MTYWPVAFCIFIGAIWLLANSIKNHGSAFAWIAGCSYGVAAVAGFNICNPADGVLLLVIVTFIGGSALMLIGLAFMTFWKQM